MFHPKSIAVPGVANLSPYEPGLPLEELERRYGVSNAIKLASNENPLGPSPEALKRLSSGKCAIELYPDGNGWNLKKALAEHHGVEMEQITLGNGSNEVLEFVARVFSSKGDSGVISEYCFVVFRLALLYTQATVKTVKAVNFGHDLVAMANAVDETTKVVYIGNPNNPTGTWSTASELKKFFASIPESVIVVVDEAYAEYCTDSNYPECITWLGDHPNLVVTRTFSKIYGLAGLRIGYAVSSPEIGDLLNRVRAPFNSNSMAQEAALAGLYDIEHQKRSKELNTEQMAVLHDGFQKIGLKTSGTAGNFVVVEVTKPVQELHEKLLKNGVIVRPLASYGMPYHFRVTVGKPEQNQRVLQEFEKMVM